MIRAASAARASDGCARKHAMRHRIGPDMLQHGRCGEGGQPIQHQRNLFHPRGDDRSRHRRDFAAAQPAHDLERIARRRLMQCQCCIHRSHLAQRDMLLDALTNPRPGFAVKHGGKHRGSARLAAGADAAETDEVMPAGDRFHAEGDGRRARPLIQRCILRDVPGRHIKRQVEHFEPDISAGAHPPQDTLSRGDSPDIVSHLAFGRPRSAVAGDAMRCGENRHHGFVQLRRRLAGPGRQPDRRVFKRAALQPAFLADCVARGGARRLVAIRQGADQITDVVQGSD